MRGNAAAGLLCYHGLKAALCFCEQGKLAHLVFGKRGVIEQAELSVNTAGELFCNIFFHGVKTFSAELFSGNKLAVGYIYRGSEGKQVGKQLFARFAASAAQKESRILKNKACADFCPLVFKPARYLLCRFSAFTQPARRESKQRRSGGKALGINNKNVFKAV